jgi:hypothetical protein
MSKTTSKCAESSEAATATDAPAGYGNPPKASRFVPGRSGNPKGRPKKHKRAEALAQFFGNDDYDRWVLEEAERTVTVQEKGRSVEMPAIKAMLRMAAVAAIKGDRSARDFFGQSVREAKRDQAKKKEEVYNSYQKHVEKYYPLFVEAEKNGQPAPEIYPRPCDLYFNDHIKEVRLDGPISPEDAALLRVRTGNAMLHRMRANEAGERYERARSPAKRTQLLERWHKEQARFDEINDTLPLNYQTKLEYRSYEPGASEPQPDFTLIEFLRKRRGD